MSGYVTNFTVGQYLRSSRNDSIWKVIYVDGMTVLAEKVVEGSEYGGTPVGGILELRTDGWYDAPFHGRLILNHLPRKTQTH